MLTYYISQSNGFTVRTEDTGSSNLTLSLENLFTHKITNYVLSGSEGSYDFTPYENILSFTASLEGAVSVGEQFRATITDTTSSIWRGSIEVFASQSVDKSEYVTQRDWSISHESDNEYIVL
tara:strand:+ start:2571 stop:2936 length:366 start_codon:yes stop_codon:yes gene_type:complete